MKFWLKPRASMKNDKTYLGHIRDAIQKIEAYIDNVSYEQFISNDMMIDAVVRELGIIGEASNNLTKEFQNNHPHIFWAKMKGMRNFLVHEYFGVNTKVVWDTCKSNLPELKSFITDVMD